MHFIDITGHVSGRLTAMWPCGHYGLDRRRIYWMCSCLCGNYHAIEGHAIRKNKTLSCGCQREESHTVHGHSPRKQTTGEYRSWSHMNARCRSRHKNYGGRGISVCARWNPQLGGSFQNFLEDLGSKPSPEYTIERRDNNGNYEPANCYWATRKEQINNRRPQEQIRHMLARVDEIRPLWKAGASKAKILRMFRVSRDSVDKLYEILEELDAIPDNVVPIDVAWMRKSEQEHTK